MNCRAHTIRKDTRFCNGKRSATRTLLYRHKHTNEKYRVFTCISCGKIIEGRR